LNKKTTKSQAYPPQLALALLFTFILKVNCLSLELLTINH
jgi:hypothetical protein